ncbi:MAG: YdeI/OmpD-associated family protein [Thermoanaerobaculaceae bacterium]|jgi:uncharacterized protein YdeI (YjbR/CyaY-like superfamily)|nr:YdeI/OmpD-associated family protein [Thermoanaerobaculaceae bacterium]
MGAIPLLEVEGQEAWRTWLEAHHDTIREVWLVFWKKHTGRQSMTYEEAVEEALCWGWIDSILRRFDDDRYAQKFTPRTDPRKWSPSNRTRLRRLLAAGRMTPAGLACVDPAVLATLDDPAPPLPAEERALPPELEAVLRAEPCAREAFDRLPRGRRRLYTRWITAAKRDETRRRRLAEVMTALVEGRPVGMK